MTTVKDLTNYLEQIAPLHLQESYDNAGLICGHPNWEVTGVQTSLDCTEAVIAEAKARNCNVVVAHHPIVFRGLKRFAFDDYVARAIMRAIKEDVAIYAIHTNLDNVFANGVNERFAQQLGLKDLQILSPKGLDPSIGSGMIGLLPEPVHIEDFFAHLKDRMQAPLVRHTRHTPKARVQKVAICGGAGSFLLERAKEENADVFVTGDFKYHEFFDADDRIVICDIGHYESEQFTIPLLASIIREKFSTFAVLCTELNTNPVHYFV